MVSSTDRWAEGVRLKPATAIVGFVIPGNLLPVVAAPNLEWRWVLLRGACFCSTGLSSRWVHEDRARLSGPPFVEWLRRGEGGYQLALRRRS